MAREQQTGFQKKKYEELILHELNYFLRKNLNDKVMQFVSFTQIVLNKDYSLAKIYWDSFDESAFKKIEAGLLELSPKIRKYLSQNLKLRHTPELKFYYNSQFKDENRIDELLYESKIIANLPLQF